MTKQHVYYHFLTHHPGVMTIAGLLEKTETAQKEKKKNYLPVVGKYQVVIHIY